MALTVNGVIETWMYSKLTGTSAINTALSGHIFAEEIPQDDGDVYPAAIFAFIAGGDTMYAGANRAFSTLIYKVVVVGTGSFEDLDEIYTLIDTAIHGSGGSVSGGEVISCVRQQPLKMTETDTSGKKYRHSGGLYRIQARPA